MKKIYLLFYVFCHIVANNQIKSQEIAPLSKKEFNEVKILNGQEIKIPEILLIPSGISISNDKLLIVDDGSDTYFHLYSYPNLKKIGSCGQKGEGPNELNFSPVLSFFNGDKIEFYSFPKNSIFDISLDCFSVKNSNKSCIQLTGVLPPDLINTQNAIKLDNNTIVGYGVNGGKLFFYDIKTDDVLYKTFPMEFNNIQEQSKNVIYNGFMACSPNMEKIVFASLYFDYFCIYNDNGKILAKQTSKNNDNIFMIKGKITTDDTKMYYTSVYATDNYFYLLNVGGKSTNDFMREIDENKFKCEIQKYDWNGNPIAAYIINKPAKSFCVTENFHQIIIIDPLSEDNPIVSFKY